MYLFIYFDGVQRFLLLLINKIDVCVNSEQISEKEKIVEMKQSKIEKMTEIINLMRKSNLLNSDDD